MPWNARQETRRAGGADSPWPWGLLAWAGIACGAGLQLAEATANRSLWHDEAMLALNVLGRDWHELLSGRLWFEQAAPPLYLILVRLMAVPFSGAEFALRLPSLAAGVATLIGIWAAGRRIVGHEAAAWAVWILAMATPIVHYANEVKPYQWDALMAIVIVGLTWRVAEAGRGSLWLGIVGSAAILLSLPAAFVLTAAGTLLALEGFLNRRRDLVLTAVRLGIVWVVTFALLYLTTIRVATGTEFMQAFWKNDFLVPGPGFVERTLGGLLALAEPLPVPGRFRTGTHLLVGVIAVLLILGNSARPRILMLLGGPILVSVMASMLGLYPFRGRLLLFAAPLTALLAAGACQRE